MSILRRKQQPVDTVAPEMRDMYMDRAGMLSDMWFGSHHERVYREVRLEDLGDTADGPQMPIPVLGATALSGNFLRSEPGSSDPIRRATGKEMIITIPRGEVAGELVSASKHALLDLKAANGHFYGNLHNKLMADAGEANAFKGARRKLAEFTYDDERQDWVLVGVVTDNHPVIMIDHFVRPHPLKPTEFQYAHSIPRFPVLEDERIYQLTGMIVKRAPDLTEIGREESDLLREMKQKGHPWNPFREQDVIPGLALMHALANIQREDPTIKNIDDYLKAGHPASQEELYGYSRLPKGSSRTNLFNASFPYRASALYGSILEQAGINGNFLDTSPKELKTSLQEEISTKIHEAALAQCARTRIKRNTVEGKGLYASIGLLDTTDPTMGHLTKQLIDIYKKNPDMPFDPEDPNDMDKLQGAIVIEHNGSAQGGRFMMKRIGEKSATPLEGIMPILKLHRQDHEGFQYVTQAIDELASGDFNGLPKMPGLVGLFLSPRNTDEGTPTRSVNLLVDIDQLPGYGAEWFYTSPDTQPFSFFSEELTPNKTTLIDIMRGRYARMQVGAAAVLRNVSHIMVNTNGITTDDFGTPRGYNIESLLGPGTCFDLSVPVVAAQVVGESVALVPASDTEQVRVTTTKALDMSPNNLTQIASRKEIKRANTRGERLPLAFTATDTLEEDGHAQVVGGIIDSEGRVHASVQAAEKAEELENNIKERTNGALKIKVPVPEVRVVAYN